MVRNTREGTTVTHREYLFDVARTADTFSIDTVVVNPGISNSFPWLSQIASRYESYTFERLDYVYQPMVPTTQPGSIMMAIDFDAADAAPSSKQVLMAYAGANRGAPWQPFKISASNIDRKKMVSERYVRSGQLPANTDVKTYDLGNLFVATVGTGAPTVTLGEIYVEYTVRFRTPQIQGAPGVGVNRKVAQAGTVNVGPTGILANIANYVGEGATPALLASSLNSLGIVVPPELNNFLLTLQSYPDAGSGNWQQAFSSVLTNPTIDGVPEFASVSGPATQMWKVGKPTQMPYAGATQGTKSVLTEAYAFYKNPDLETGTGAYNNLKGLWNNVVLQLRNGLVNGNGNWNMQYTISPIPSEYPDLTVPSWIGIAGSAVSAAQANFQWPTNAIIGPARGVSRLMVDDGVNKVTYGRIISEDKRKAV